MLIQVEADSLSGISADCFRIEHGPSGPPSWPYEFYDLRAVSFPSRPNTIDLKRLAGFWWCTMRNPREILIAEAVIPFWAIALATAVLPLGRTIRGVWSRTRALRQESIGRCPTCGYDLRASPDRCPECGTSKTPA